MKSVCGLLLLWTVCTSASFAGWESKHKGMGCSRRGSHGIYTFEPSRRCDGWPRTSLSRCKQYCRENKLPPGCRPSKNTQCNYVIWDNNKDFRPGFCQLASSCRLQEKASSITIKVRERDRWESEHKGMECSRLGSHGIYTFEPSRRCDGWPRTSLSRCKQYCRENRLPPGCRPSKNTQCNYVIWDNNKDFRPGFCQLASSCWLQEKASSITIELRRSPNPCNLPKYKPGFLRRCQALFPRVYFDQSTKACKLFYYGGCGATANNFKTFEECKQKCGGGEQMS